MSELNHECEITNLEAAHKLNIDDKKRCYERIVQLDKQCSSIHKQMLAVDRRELDRLRNATKTPNLTRATCEVIK